MSDQTSYISQIKEEEAKAASMLKQVEVENDKRLSKANEEATQVIFDAEEAEREKAKVTIQKAKEDAKEIYGKRLVEADNTRRDVIEGGKTKITKGKKQVIEAFMHLFN